MMGVAYANQKAQGNCEQGGNVVVTNGQSSTTKVQQSFPTCTVTVYLTGTTTPATIYSDNSSTPLSNPFTADVTGHWGWYAANGRYDVQLSGGGISAPFTISDILLSDPAGGGTTVSSITAGSGISTSASTGAVTVTNTWGAVPTGSQTQYLQIEPNVGNLTTYQWASREQSLITDFSFPSITPSANLTAGSNATITLPYAPLGMNWSDTRHYVRIVDGVAGNDNAVLILAAGPGTCLSGATSSCTITLSGSTITLNHTSGNWSLQPASSGAAECLYAIRACVIPPGNWPVYATVLLNVGSNANGVLRGVGQQVSVLYRASGNQNDILLFDQSIFGGLGFNLLDFTIENGGVPIFNNTGGSAIDIAQSGQAPILIHGVRVHNGWQGFQLGGSAGGSGQVYISDSEYFQDSTYAASYQSNCGLCAGGTGGAVSNTMASNCRFWTADATQSFALTAGVKITNADGINISNSGIIKGQVGVYLLANNNNITNVFMSNNIIDDVLTGGLLLSGSHVISNVQWIGGSINAYHSHGSHPFGIQLDSTTSNIGNVQFQSTTVDGFSSAGLEDDSTATTGKVQIQDSFFINNGDGATGYGINLSSGSAGVIAQNNIAYTVSGAPETQNYGIGVQGSLTGSVISGNTVLGNSTAGMLFGGGTFTNVQVTNNVGWNPIGVSTLTCSASPCTLPSTAKTSPAFLYLAGGTVSNVTRGGTSVCTSSPCMIALAPGQQAIVTYSGAPTTITLDVQ